MPIRAWLADSHQRIFQMGNRPGHNRIRIHTAKGEQVSFQAAVQYNGPSSQGKIRLEFDSTSSLSVRARKVGYVPVPHHNANVPKDEMDCIGHIPGYVPDPLFDETETAIGKGETAAFWFTVKAPADHPSGQEVITVTFQIGEGKNKVQSLEPLRCELAVHDFVLAERMDFPVTHWFYNDALLDWYRLRAFEDKFWQIVEQYIANVVEHGQDTLYVPIITPPLDGVKRPSQLLGIQKSGSPEASGKANADSNGSYRFDWHLVKRYIDLAKHKGIRHFEWAHLFTQWGCRYAPRVYLGHGENETLLWGPETLGKSKIYRSFLRKLLPEWKTFLQEESLENRSFFHVSDEPGAKDLECYRKAKSMLKELAPWMKTMDAVSELTFAREGLTDIPIPSIQATKVFIEDGQSCWTYFCCGPRGRYLNRLVDTPLIKIRMAGWLFYRFGVHGFLHWGYNYWYKSQTRQLIDPYVESSGLAWPEWAYGDTFVVYPGENGPVDTIRWEIFAESLQDLALLQQAERETGFGRDSRLLADLADFDSFPKSKRWWANARSQIFALLEDGNH